MREGRLEEIEATAEDAWFISEVRPDIAELVAEVRSLRARLEAVCDVVSDAAAYGDDIPAARVLEAVRGDRAVRERSISFDEIMPGDFLRVSFPPRGGMSDNWTIEHSRTAIAYHKHDLEWLTSDGQVLVRGHDTAKIELLSRLG